MMRSVLGRREYFNHVGIHVNEMNTVPPPWPYRKTILEQQDLLPQILTVIEDFLEETDVELVHWAQMLDSGVDALGWWIIWAGSGPVILPLSFMPGCRQDGWKAAVMTGWAAWLRRMNSVFLR